MAYGVSDFRVFRGTARTRKRCPHCGKMVEVGTPAVFRSFRKERYGWQRGGFLGTSKDRVPTTHAYHVSCADSAPELRPEANPNVEG